MEGGKANRGGKGHFQGWKLRVQNIDLKYLSGIYGNFLGFWAIFDGGLRRRCSGQQRKTDRFWIYLQFSVTCSWFSFRERGEEICCRERKVLKK